MQLSPENFRRLQRASKLELQLGLPFLGPRVLPIQHHMLFYQAAPGLPVCSPRYADKLPAALAG